MSAKNGPKGPGPSMSPDANAVMGHMMTSAVQQKRSITGRNTPKYRMKLGHHRMSGAPSAGPR